MILRMENIYHEDDNESMLQDTMHIGYDNDQDNSAQSKYMPIYMSCCTHDLSANTFVHSRCNSSFSESFGLGIMNQHTMVTAINDTRIGCNTHTSILVLSCPVMTGNADPPICAKTKTIESAVDLVSLVNNLDPTDIA